MPVDLTQAVYWCRKAAQAGSAKAQNQLGQYFINGKGVARDDPQAFHWFSLSANQNQDSAQANLAWCYQRGSGTEKDLSKAFK